MDHITLVAYQLDRQRHADLVRDTELLRQRAERETRPEVADAPARRRRLAAAWQSFLAFAHLGHPVAH